MTTGPGTIAVVSGVLSRYLAFHKSLAALRRPQGTMTSYSFGANIAENRNHAVVGAQGEWIWFIDDDHAFGGDTLERLLLRDKDIIVPVVLHREPPHAPVIYSEFDSQKGEFKRVFLEKQGGVGRVVAAGTAGMLIKRKVFEKLPQPWFEVGQLRTDSLSEDLWFCKKAGEAGFEVWVDWETQMGHITPAAVWPVNTPDGWKTGYHLGGKGGMPVIQAAKEEVIG